MLYKQYKINKDDRFVSRGYYIKSPPNYIKYINHDGEENIAIYGNTAKFFWDTENDAIEFIKNVLNNKSKSKSKSKSKFLKIKLFKNKKI